MYSKFRPFLGWIAALLLIVSPIMWLICAWLDSDSPHACWWISAAIIGVIAGAIELLCRYFDHSEIAELRARLDGRHLSHAIVETWKRTLSQYKRQWFFVIQVGWGDHEAKRFAKEICATLMQCGWVGNWRYDEHSESLDFIINSGVGVFIGMGKASDPNRKLPPQENMDALAALLQVIRDAKIEESNALAPEDFFDFGCIGIMVGRKP